MPSNLLGLARIRRYCEGRVPVRLRDQIRIEIEVHGRAVVIVECRAPWTPEIGPEWTRFPIARLRHVAGRGVWKLDWRDRNQRWHRYDDIGPSANVTPLLAEIGADPTAIFGARTTVNLRFTMSRWCSVASQGLDPEIGVVERKPGSTEPD